MAALTPTLREGGPPAAGGPRPRRSPLRRRRAVTAYVFLLPALVFFGLLYFYPLISEAITSLYTGAKVDQFVGVGNYTRAAGDAVIRNSFWVTIRYAAGVLILSVVLGLVMAIILNQRIRGRVIFRAILLVPYLTTVAVVGVLWRNLLDPQIGIINSVLTALHLPPQAWLTTHPLLTVTLIAVWQETGYIMVLFLAGLQGIPDMYYEAARVDGASPVQRFRNITLPTLAPTTLFVTIVAVISSLQQFAIPYIVTNGGPADATDLFVLRTFNTAFSYRDFGYASALAFIMLAIILIISIVQLRLGRSNDG